MLSPPAPDYIEVIESKAQRIDPAVATGTSAVCTMLCQPFANRFWLRAFMVRFQGRHVGRGRRRWGSQDGLQYPRAAQNGAGPVWVRRNGQHSRHSEQSSAMATL